MTTWYEARNMSSGCADSGPTKTFASFESVQDAVNATKRHPWNCDVYQIDVNPFKSYEEFVDHWESDSHPVRLGDPSRRETLVWGVRKSLNGITWERGYIDCRDRMSDPDYVKYLELKKRFGGQ